MIFFCENNGYAVSVRQSESTSVADIARRAAAYDMPGVDRRRPGCRRDLPGDRRGGRAGARGLGPTLIEAKTYRFHEHAYGLRLSQRVPRARRRSSGWRDEFDPIELFERRLTAWALLSPAEQAAIRVEVTAEVAAAVEFARTSPFPPPEDAYRDIFADEAQP